MDRPQPPNAASKNEPAFMQAQSFVDSVVPKDEFQVRTAREKQGLCPTCGQTTTHRKKILSMEPLTIEGKVLEGWCLRCNTMDFVLAQPKVLRKMEKKRKKGEKRSKHNSGTRDVTSMPDLNGSVRSDDSSPMTSRSTSWDYSRFSGNLPSYSDIEAMENQFHRASRDLTGTGDLPGNGRSNDATHSTPRSAVSWDAAQYNNVLPTNNLEVLPTNNLEVLPTNNLEVLPTNNYEVITNQFHRPMEDLPVIPGESSILEQMQNNPYSSEIQSRGCLDLVDLYEEGQEDLIEVVDAITNAMEKHVTNVEVQRRGCRAFRRLSTKRQRSASEEPEINADNCAKMEVVGAIHSVINAMNNHHNSENVQWEAMHFIRNCLQATGSSKGVVLSRNGIEVIVRAMWNLETCTTVQEDGCTILWSLAVSDHEAQYSIVFNNGIGAILNGMSKHLSIEKVQYCACGALQTLSSSNPEIQQNMLEIGAFDAIFNSMSEHKYSKSVAEAASIAVKNLLNLASENPLVANICKMSDRHVQVITRVMKVNADNVSIQKKMCQLLEKAAQSHLNIETLQRNESLRYILQESAASYPDECLESVITVMSIIDT